MRGFREIRETKVKEVNDKKEEEYGYRKIKPESNITFHDSQLLWEQIFINMEEIDRNIRECEISRENNRKAFEEMDRMLNSML